MIQITVAPEEHQDPRARMARGGDDHEMSDDKGESKSKDAMKKISEKIAFLVKNEGLSQKEAAGKAYSLWQDGSL